MGRANAKPVPESGTKQLSLPRRNAASRDNRNPRKTVTRPGKAGPTEIHRPVSAGALVLAVVRVQDLCRDATPIGDLVALLAGPIANCLVLFTVGGRRPRTRHTRPRNALAAPRAPGMVVKRLNTKQIGGGFFGGDFTADPVLEELLIDPMGVLGNMSTTALFKPYPLEPRPMADGEEDDEEAVVHEPRERPKGDLYVTGVTFKGGGFFLYRFGI